MNIKHLSYSTCKKIYRKGIDYALGTKLGLIDETYGKAADIGTMAHALVLGGDPQWIVSPYDDFRKKEARDWRDEQTQMIIKESEFDEITRIADAILAHPLAKQLIDSCDLEQKLTAKIAGIDFLGYADGVSKDRTVMFDLKTTGQFDQFKYQAFKNDYDLQASVYRLFGDNSQYYFVVAETCVPYRVQVFGTSDEFFEGGDRKLQHSIEEFHKFRTREGDSDLERITFNVGETVNIGVSGKSRRFFVVKGKEMTEIETVEQKPSTIQGLLKTDWIAKSAERTLGARGQQFLTSVLTLANSNNLVGACEPYSLYNACLTAATLDLPLNQNLGFAYIVPYKNNKTGVNEAQFQMGYKGFVQLAIRSGKFSRIGANEVYEGQLVGLDDFTGEPIFNFNNKLSNTIVGYMAYFELTNGFRKASYMPYDKVEAHAKKYSQSYKKGFGVWKDNFDGMSKKTVLKLLISKFAPLSTQMEQALIQDQKTSEGYVDNKITFEVEDAAIEGELIEPETILDDIFEDPIGQLDNIIENTKDLITDKQLKKLVVITNNLSEDSKQTELEARELLYPGRSRKTFTKQEASAHIEYVLGLTEG